MKRIFPILLIVLLSLALFMLIQLGAGDLSSHDHVLNESSILKNINEELSVNIQKKFERIQENSRHSTSPRVLDARSKAEMLNELIKALNKTLKETTTLAHSKDDVDSLLKKVKTGIAEIQNLIAQDSSAVKAVKVIQSTLDNVLQNDIHEDYTTLSSLHLQNDILTFSGTYMDNLSMETEAMSVKFETGFPEKKSPWVDGLITFDAPAQMNRDQKSRVQVRISKQFEKTLLDNLRKDSNTTVDTLSVGDIMMVKLLGDAFEITPYDDEEQGVTDTGYTQWEFDVTPRKSGDQELFIKAGIIYYVPNLGPTKKYFPVYEKTVTVHVSVWEEVAGFAYERWEFIVSTILIPVGIWLISLFRQRKKAGLVNKQENS